VYFLFFKHNYIHMISVQVSLIM